MATHSYEISLVVEGVELSNDVLDRIFTAFPDAVPARIADVVTITTPITASSAYDALTTAIQEIRQVLPEGTIRRVDQDLVAIPDIAERTDRTRESVRLLVDGHRGPGKFPAPVGTVGSGIRVWPWASVLEWFSSSLGIDLGEHGIPPEVAAIVDAELAAAQAVITARSDGIVLDDSSFERLLTALDRDSETLPKLREQATRARHIPRTG